MNVLLVYRFLTVSVLLCGEAHQSFLENVNFQRVVASHEAVYAKIVFEPVYQVRV